MSSRKTIQPDPHPASSRELAPSDFLLFGHIRRKLIKYDIHDRQSLSCTITLIFDETGHETLMPVETWINRLERVIQHEREYFHQ
jgi:hypothetical protein